MKRARIGSLSRPLSVMRNGWHAPLLFLCVGWMLFGAAGADAAPVYSVGGRFGGFSASGVEGSFFQFGPDGVALDPATGDGYATDGGNARVQKFGAELEAQFLLTYGWRVQEGGGNEFETCTSGCTFGTEGAGAGQFGGEFAVDNTQPVGVAVDPENKDAYVTDTFNDRVEYFTEDGAFVGEFNGAGTPSTSFASPRGIAVDKTGDVFVEDTGHDVIDKFSSTGTFVCQITGQTLPASDECNGAGSGTPEGGLDLASALGAGLAVDAAGDVYIADTGHDVVDEFSPAGAYVRQFGAGVLSEPQAVTVDGSGNVFVVSGGNTVIEFDSTGVKINEFGSTEIGQSYGLATNGARVYVADRGKGEVLIFGVFAAVHTEAAGSVSMNGATMRGTVNPDGEPLTSCQFEYGVGEVGSFEHSVECSPTAASIDGAATTPVPVSAQLTGLTPDTPYHYRLVAGNANKSTVQGGTEFFVTIGPEPVSFGFQLFGPHALGAFDSNEAVEVEKMMVANPLKPDAQAGSHPLDVTTRMFINTEADGVLPTRMQPKDYIVNVPAGFAGSVAHIPRCKMSEFSTLLTRQEPNGCPTASQVGVIRLFIEESDHHIFAQLPEPVYNMVPPPGAPAELAFIYLDIGQPVVFQLRSDSDYGITAKVEDLSEREEIVGSELTLWGVPAASVHDGERFLPKNGEQGGLPPGGPKGEPLPAGSPEVPFLTNPTRCGEELKELEGSIVGDAWSNPGALAQDGLPVLHGSGWVEAKTQMFPDGVKGCGALRFSPQLEVTPITTPTTSEADSPAGLTVNMTIPQSEDPKDLATPSLKDVEIKLPEGLAISPSRANGLEGCTPAQIGLHTTQEPSCPNGSQVGEVQVTTPLLPETLTGQVYLSSVHSGNMFHIYVVIRGQGVLVKLEGNVQANEQTGQITSTFNENPQLPFSDLKLTLFGGQDAALATPQQCGTFTTNSVLVPWSHEPAPGETAGTPDATPSSPFAISSGCASTFTPSFVAGSTNPVAGAYSPFTLSFSRQDGEQDLAGLQVKMPLGLVGKLAGVAECSNAQIAAAEQSSGTAEVANASCPASSQVGTVEAGAGAGEQPFFLPGKAYLTGPYKGAPYGLAVVVPALAGPFDLGDVVVRAAIAIDPHTAQVTVTSDPLPQMLDGVPLRVRRVEVTVNRNQFTLNPTSCEPTQVTGTLTSASGASHAVSSRFQVDNCASLAFKPGFAVTTHAGHTRRNGAYLRVKVTSGSGQANIGSVRVELPKILPSRLETLKMACSAKQFAENPAGCPAASRVGTAVASTPILSTPLTGPAIFVSHGGAGFPDLDVVLQGSGVTVDLEGNTNIVKGITISNFKSVPDVPVNSFQLTLPQGKDSALAATGNLCFKTVKKHGKKVKQRVKLIMPTTITGHNGAVVQQQTVIQVQGCGKAKSHPPHKKKK
jgi:sugar lactone lactonase YvrE